MRRVCFQKKILRCFNKRGDDASSLWKFSDSSFMITSMYLFEILALGVIGGLVPGSILMSVFAETLSGGFLKGLRVVFKALFAETLLAFFILTLAYTLNMSPTVFYAISIFGGIFLFWLAWQVWSVHDVEGGKKETLFSLSKIFLLTVLNGGFWIFWITVSVPRALLLENIFTGGRFLFLVLFEFGWLAATVFLAVLFSFFRPILQRKNLVGIVFKVCSVILALFGVRSLYEGIHFLFFS